jgi:hypothetical protein
MGAEAEGGARGTIYGGENPPGSLFQHTGKEAKMPLVQEVQESPGVGVVVAALRRLGGWQRTADVAKACYPGVDWVLSLLHEAEAIGYIERRQGKGRAFYEWRVIER